DQIIERLSPDITARFLNLANSAYCGMDVRSIGHAVKLLGYNAMRQNLITSFLIEHFTRHLELGYFDFDTFHAHSQLTGLIAKALGDMIDYRHSGDLYTAAILHNLGQRLKQLLPECRQRYREGVSAELQKGGYQKAFPGLLESVSATVSVAAAGVLSPAEAR
ncbi:MAG: HDOD domain-containing protein, partial [Desulfobacterales bacterium]